MTQQLPLVSLIITSYNRESMIAKAIESALEQDYPNLEIVISDNCSTDNTDAVIRRYLNDPRVRYNRNETNIGMLPNYRRATYEISSGSYVTYVSSDDYLTDKSFISDAVNLALKYEDADIVYGRMAVDSTTNGVFWEMPEQPYFVKEIWDGKDFFFKSTESGLLSWGACLMKRTAMENVGCLLTDYHNADLDSNYKIVLDSRVAFINRICYVQVTHNDNNGFPAHAGKLMKSLECFESVASYAIAKLPMREKEIKQWKEHFLLYTMNIGLHSLIERDYEQYKLFKKELRKTYPALYASHTKSKVFRKMVLLHPVKRILGPGFQKAIKTRLRKFR